MSACLEEQRLVRTTLYITPILPEYLVKHIVNTRGLFHPTESDILHSFFKTSRFGDILRLRALNLYRCYALQHLTCLLNL